MVLLPYTCQKEAFFYKCYQPNVKRILAYHLYKLFTISTGTNTICQNSKALHLCRLLCLQHTFLHIMLTDAHNYPEKQVQQAAVCPILQTRKPRFHENYQGNTEKTR